MSVELLVECALAGETHVLVQNQPLLLLRQP
jgi:hypothetical protein